MVFRSPGGAADEGEDLAHDKIVSFPVGLRQPVRRHAAMEENHTQGLSLRNRVVVVQLVPQIGITQLYAGRDAVVLTVRGRGTLGARVRVVAYRDEPERCVLHKTQVVEGRLVRVEGVRREAVTLECKLITFLSYLFFQVVRFSPADPTFSSYVIRHAVTIYHWPA